MHHKSHISTLLSIQLVVTLVFFAGSTFFGSGCSGAVQLPSEVLTESPNPDSRADGGFNQEGGSMGWEASGVRPLEFALPEKAPLPESMERPTKPHLQKVIFFSPADGASYGQEEFPKKIQGPPQGLGDKKGSLDVVSLGCGGEIVLEFSEPLIGNGPGPDFIVFENAFSYGGKETFAEPGEVSVSIDGKTWYTFPCDPKESSWPFPQCAGVKPVYSSSKTNIDPTDVEKAGGDAFDLDNVGLPFARFVRIVDKSADSKDSADWCGQYNAGFDLDAVSVLWGYSPRR